MLGILLMGKRIQTRGSWSFSALGLVAAPVAFAMPVFSDGTPKHVTPSLICDHASVAPGAAATLGLDFAIEKKWHMYWNGRNENGFPPKVEWELPAGFIVDAIQWPAPVRRIEPGDLLNHVYLDHVTLLVPLHVPATVEPGSTVSIKAKLSWLVCDEICVPEDAEVQIQLSVSKLGDPRLQASTSDAKKFQEARSRLPRELPKDSKGVFITWTDKSVLVSVPGATHLFFYPDEDCVPFGAPIKDADAAAPKLSIRLGDPEPEHTALTGVLEIGHDNGKPSEFFHLHSPPPTKTPEVRTNAANPATKSP